MALSKTTLRLAKILYWVFMIFIHLFIVYQLFAIGNGRPIAAVIWLILGLMLIYIMYPYYFPPGDPGASWPPYVTACPDYLTLIAPNACVDYVGLHSPSLKKSDPSLPPPPITDTAHVFNSGGSLAEKAAKAQQYGLSWEGVV